MHYMFLLRKYWGCYIVINLPLFDPEKSCFFSKQKRTTTTTCIWSCFHRVRVWKYRGGRGALKKKIRGPLSKNGPVSISHRIHVWYIDIYISLICMINVGTYTSPMDAIGLGSLSFLLEWPFCFLVSGAGKKMGSRSSYKWGGYQPYTWPYKCVSLKQNNLLIIGVSKTPFGTGEDGSHLVKSVTVPLGSS